MKVTHSENRSGEMVLSHAVSKILKRSRQSAVPEEGNANVFEHCDPENVKDLLETNTRTARRKLRKLGVLTSERSLEDVKLELEKLSREEQKMVEDIYGTDLENDNIGLSKGAHESLIASLASQNKELEYLLKEQLGDVVSDSSEEDTPEESQRREQVTVLNKVTQEEGGDNQEPFPSLEAKQDRFEQHIEFDCEVIDKAAIMDAHRVFEPAPSAFQAWKKSNVSLDVGKGSTLPDGISSKLDDYSVRQRLQRRWAEVSGDGRVFNDFASKKQSVFFSLLNSYLDILYTVHDYPKEPDSPDPMLDAAILHILNHISKSADRIRKNNERIKSGLEQSDAVPRDQGFVRPKVLILLPFRNQALSLVQRLLSLAIKETRTDTIQNKSRFLEEFGIEEDQEQVSARAKRALLLKPKDHKALFAGNIDDHFRLGMKLTKGSIRLFTDFYDSDILVASPLGLATKLEEETKEPTKEGPSDFLSSIEILLISRSDVMLMQNWSHVVKILSLLNKMPKAQQNVDIMRIREWYAAGKASCYRQNIVLSSFPCPELNGLISKQCSSHTGSVKWSKKYGGVLSRIGPKLRHTFEPLPSVVQSPLDEPQCRFDNFKSNIWPKIRESSRGGGQLLYIPSYFDYVKVRNYLREQAASFVGLCEYTDVKDMARARSYFSDGRKRVLIYTERAQFFNRHLIQGIKDIFFYQLPDHPQFYSELANFVEDTIDGSMATVHTCYSRYDLMKLERIVGSDRAKTMIRKGCKGSLAGTFVFT